MLLQTAMLLAASSCVGMNAKISHTMYREKYFMIIRLL